MKIGIPNDSNFRPDALDVAPLRQGRARATPINRYADAHMRSFPRERLWREPVAA
jgi:hypothetical protein